MRILILLLFLFSGTLFAENFYVTSKGGHYVQGTTGADVSFSLNGKSLRVADAGNSLYIAIEHDSLGLTIVSFNKTDEGGTIEWPGGSDYYGIQNLFPLTYEHTLNPNYPNLNEDGSLDRDLDPTTSGDDETLNNDGTPDLDGDPETTGDDEDVQCEPLDKIKEELQKDTNVAALAEFINPLNNLKNTASAAPVMSFNLGEYGGTQVIDMGNLGYGFDAIISFIHSFCVLAFTYLFIRSIFRDLFRL